MTIKLIEKGEVICIASEVFESYQRAVPFLVEMDFDLNEFITAVKYSQKIKLGNRGVNARNLRMLLAQGILSTIPNRNTHLGAFGE